MFEMKYDDDEKIKNEVMELLHEKRNLMFYDGIRDGLDENVDYRFFYSSPGDALEFVIGDIYRKPVNIEFKGRNIESLGKINIIREPGDYLEGAVECLFGIVLIERIKVREIDKINIALSLNYSGIQKMKEAIEYFEKSFCKRCER